MLKIFSENQDEKDDESDFEDIDDEEFANECTTLDELKQRILSQGNVIQQIILRSLSAPHYLNLP